MAFFPECLGERKSFGIVGKAQAAELPASPRIEEVAVCDAGMTVRRRQRGTAQHHLVDHEFAVVFTERAVARGKAWIGRIARARPLPDDAEGTAEMARAGGTLPLSLRRQMLAGPVREGVRLVVAHMRNRGGGIDRLQTAKGELAPLAIAIM